MLSRRLFSTVSLKNLASPHDVTKHIPIPLVKSSDILLTKGEGSWIWDDKGNKYLDFTCGIGVTNTGHCHPRVVKAIQEQASQMIHAQQNLYKSHLPQVKLIDRLVGIVPKNLDKFLFVNSGAEAVENAIKIVRGHTKKTNIIAFQGAFHGRTIGAMSLTSSKVFYRQGFQPLMSGVHITPYPYCLHCPVRKARGGSGYRKEPYITEEDRKLRQCCDHTFNELENIFKLQTHPTETAAIIIEPILGEGGFLTPPLNFLKFLREICNKHNILLVLDEVQSGMGRTGKWWGHQHWDGVYPDLMLFAKGIGSGVPLAGVATTSKIIDSLDPGSVGGTYGGNAIASAAGAATIDVIQDENLLTNATERGAQLMKGLVQISNKFPQIIDIRGRGLMVAVEFEEEKDGSHTLAARVVKAALKQKLLLMTSGARETIRFLPPLTVNSEEVDLMLKIFNDALKEVFGK